MILFFKGETGVIYAVETANLLSQADREKLIWLFGQAVWIDSEQVNVPTIGPRKEMITPWSTNAVEITQNMGIQGITRIEEFFPTDCGKPHFDKMLQAFYPTLDQKLFFIDRQPEPIRHITDIKSYNQQEGLALNDDEIAYLEAVSARIGRPLTDSEVFGFSQVNSEHCRHKIFNGTFIIDGIEKGETLFSLIKKTSKLNPNTLISAYKDNVAFVAGPKVKQFAPLSQDKPDYFALTEIESVISLKAETHNFPTTVEPFNGAATGSGGEIRDRMAGGTGSIPLAGTAVYMTSYPRLEGERDWEKHTEPRQWLYQSPEEILIKASNGASDFGNKFGQPLICGSLYTFEQNTDKAAYGYDKVIMLAGGVGTGRKEDSLKHDPKPDDVVVVLGGDNYRIGMGGGAVSSVATGEYANAIELNAVQRANPEMQKRVYNAIRAMAEAPNNPIVSIHDHGAGGHLNSLSELVEVTGGLIDLEKLPVGDPTLSAREIIGNESQERMGLVIRKEDLSTLQAVAERERAPMYAVGRTTGDHQFTFKNSVTGETPIDLQLADMFGKPPRTIMRDVEVAPCKMPLNWDSDKLLDYTEKVLQMEAVACKDWLTNKVDRSVTGRVALQQCAGQIQLPLNNLGIMALDYSGHEGIATSIGHAAAAALVDERAGSQLAVAKALTNIVWTPLAEGLKSVSLSANWMWPCRNQGEDARLYNATEAMSDYVSALGINIPTGKDSLSMTQKYPDGTAVISPGTVIVSAGAHTSDFTKVVRPVLKNVSGSIVYYISFAEGSFELGGSAFAQLLGATGERTPKSVQPAGFIKAFNAIQSLIDRRLLLSGHDVSSGGLVTTLLELCFGIPSVGLNLNLDSLGESDVVKVLFSENPAVVIQTAKCDDVESILREAGVTFSKIGMVTDKANLSVSLAGKQYGFDVDSLRNTWYKTSYQLDKIQAGESKATERFNNFSRQPLTYTFPEGFKGTFESLGINPNRTERTGLKAAIIREKGVNGDREMAFMLHLAGFDVKDVHMTDLISGRETLDDIRLIVFVGGFSNSDVLGSAKGWAGAFKFNEKAKETLDRFFARKDTLSLGVCNGCQLMIELGLITPGREKMPKMLHNDSHKFESAFLTLDIQKNHSVMLSSLAGSRLGIWVAHGEGKFSLPELESAYHIPAKYAFENYPGNPNGSDYNTAALCSEDGRHLAIMPHLERAFYPWHWAYYPETESNHEVSPWMVAFTNAREWLKQN